MVFNKICKKCNKKFQDTSRNRVLCVDCRDSHEWYKPRKRKPTISKYSCNFFENDIEGFSYFMGYCFADGSVTKNKDHFTIMSSDYDIIEKIKNRLNYTGPIKTYIKPKHYKNSYALHFYSNIARYFKGQGLRYNKEDLSLSNIKREIYFYHFLRGLLDGDGTISLRKIRYTLNSIVFLARKNLSYELKEKLGFGVITNYKKSKCLYPLVIYAKNGYVLADNLWDKSTIYMQRKYETYLNMKNRIPKRSEVRRLVDLCCPNCNKTITKEISKTHVYEKSKSKYTTCSRLCRGELVKRINNNEAIDFSNNIIRIYKASAPVV